VGGVEISRTCSSLYGHGTKQMERSRLNKKGKEEKAIGVKICTYWTKHPPRDRISLKRNCKNPKQAGSKEKPGLFGEGGVRELDVGKT